MSLRARWRAARESSRWDGTIGTPRSANAASSFHLFWTVPDGAWVGAEATLEIDAVPTVARLYFWAMQVGFAGGGAGHIGLQWYPPHPGSTAVNWGGYAASGRELDGSASTLPSAPANVNTRDFAWVAGRAYRLRVRRAGTAPNAMVAWRGEVDDLATGDTIVVRDLWAPGDRLVSPMVWSEVFAACDDPSVTVRWSDLTVVDEHDRGVAVDEVRVNYQSLSDGGCRTTDTRIDGAAFVQVTSTERRTPQGAVLRLGHR